MTMIQRAHRPAPRSLARAVRFAGRTTTGIFSMSLIFMTACDDEGDENAAPVAEYGDAPDGVVTKYADPLAAAVGAFPAAHASENCRIESDGRGAHVLKPNKIRLGAQLSVEAGIRDGEDPDGLENEVDDDAHDDGLRYAIDTTTPEADPETKVLSIVVTNTANEVVDGYLNLLADLNRDGRWASTPMVNEEWLVQNLPVQLAPLQSLTIPVENWPSDAGPLEAWLRVAVTDSAVNGGSDGQGWDGCGTFEDGEIEDYLLASDRAFAEADDLAWDWDHSQDFDLDYDRAFAIDIEEITRQVERYAEVSVAAQLKAQTFVEAMAAVAGEAEASAAAAAAAAAAAESASAAEATASASAGAASTAVSEATSSASAVSEAWVAHPCVTVHASAKAQADAMVVAASEASASAAASAAASAEASTFAASSSAAAAAANADAQAAAAALALAGAQAQAKATAVAEAMVHAQAQAKAVAEAGAYARAQSKAWAEAYADADAAAQAVAASLAQGSFAQAEAAALAEAYARAFARARASATAAAQAWAHARVQVSLALQATARVQAEIDVLTDVQAGAVAYTETFARATAIAAASSSAAAAGSAGASQASTAAAEAQSAAEGAASAAASAEATAVAVGANECTETIIAGVSTQLDACVDERDRLSGEVMTCESRNDQLNDNLDSCNSNLSRCSADLEGLQDELEDAVAQGQMCQNDLDKCSKEFMDEQNQHQQCQSALEECLGNTHVGEDPIPGTEGQPSSLARNQGLRYSSGATNPQAQQQLADLQQRLNACQAQAEDDQQALSDCESELAALEDSCIERRHEWNAPTSTCTAERAPELLEIADDERAIVLATALPVDAQPANTTQCGTDHQLEVSWDFMLTGQAYVELRVDDPRITALSIVAGECDAEQLSTCAQATAGQGVETLTAELQADTNYRIVVALSGHDDPTALRVHGAFSAGAAPGEAFAANN